MVACFFLGKDLLNFLSHRLQWWVFSCVLSWVWWEIHLEQANSFSPVCVLSCFFISQFCWNALSHLEHVNGFSPVFILSCTFNLAVLIKALLLMKQANGFTNMGLFMNNDWVFQLQKNYKVGIGIVVLVMGIGYWGFSQYWYCGLPIVRYWYCPNEFSGIGIGVENFGIVYVWCIGAFHRLLPSAGVWNQWLGVVADFSPRQVYAISILVLVQYFATSF